MKRVVKAIVLAALLCLLPIAALAAHEAEYYYRNYCESCDPEAEFAEIFENLTGVRLTDCIFHGYNTVTAAGKEALERRAREEGLENPPVPFWVIDGVVYQGDSALRGGLPAQALTWADTTDSVVVYFYTPACESCGRADAALRDLPASVTIRRGEYAFDSTIVIKRIDASAQPDQIDRFFAAYGVPDAERITPVVFMGGRFLSGAERIERDAMEMIRLGWAVGGVRFFDEETPAAAEYAALSLAASVGAGLVAGLNPCALSMLLLFLSLAMESGRRARALVVVFLIAKVSCYLLIGVFLLEAMQALNPVWMLPLARWVMSALGGGMILLNLWDAWQIRAGRLEKLRNQLPAPLRSGLRRSIGRFMARRVWLPAVFALGVLVAAGEFLCAGQLYLIRLLAAVRESAVRQGLNLAAYCHAFIAPSAVLSGLLLGGMSSARISAFFARHMMAARLAAAIATFAMILLSWLI